MKLKTWGAVSDHPRSSTTLTMQTLFCLLSLTRKIEKMRLGSMPWAWRTTRHFSLGEIGPLINNRALQIQKANQKSGNNTARTFLIFDDNKTKANKLIKLLWKPRDWIDDDYGWKKGQDPLDQIIDTPFSIKSHHAGLVQAADLFAFILCRYAEIEDYNAEEAWPDQKTLLDKYVSSLAERLLPKSARWPARPGSSTAKWFNDIAPPSLKGLG